jgi:hypothetical protein
VTGLGTSSSDHMTLVRDSELFRRCYYSVEFARFSLGIFGGPCWERREVVEGVRVAHESRSEDRSLACLGLLFFGTVATGPSSYILFGCGCIPYFLGSRLHPNRPPCENSTKSLRPLPGASSSLQQRAWSCSSVGKPQNHRGHCRVQQRV